MTDFATILGRSAAAEAMRVFARRAAAVDAPVLLTGESGTGKGLLARAIHDAGPRARRPFVAVNCAGVPDSLFESEFFGHTRGAFTGAHGLRRGLFEQADGGTLFLDEVGELPAALQAKLLTALEDGEIRRLGAERTVRVDARIVAATGADLEQAVRNGTFRRDLYHRLLVLAHRLPALREREGDVELLARLFLEHACRKYGQGRKAFDRAAAARMLTYAWPGNVRELAHAIEAAVLAADGERIGLDHLPATLFAPPPADPDSDGPALRYLFRGSPADEKHRIQEVLRRYQGNKTRAAAALGMARNTLRHKLRLFGLHDNDVAATVGEP